MGKIALDTMQANEKALRASYRRSLETDPLKNNSQRFKREAFLEKTLSGRESAMPPGARAEVGRGMPPWHFSLIAFIQQRQTSDSSQPAASIASRLPCLAHRRSVMDAKPYSLQPAHHYRQPSRNKEP